MWKLFKVRPRKVEDPELDLKLAKKSQRKKDDSPENSSSIRNGLFSLFHTSPRSTHNSPTKRVSQFASHFLNLPRGAIQAVGTFLTLTEWNDLLRTSPAFLSIRKHSGYFDFDREHSYKFYYVLDFQQYVLQRLLQDPSRQLSLTFDGSCNVTSDFLRPFHLPEKNMRLHCVKIMDCNLITRFPVFGVVNHLIMENCSRLSDVSPFEDAGIHFLEIINCKSVRDVAPLKNIRKLTLINISPAANITLLGNHEYLKIGGENTIVPNVSMYRSIRILDLSDCYGFRQVQALEHIHYLNLSNCRQLTNVESLGYVYHLNLSNCIDLEDISGLGKGNVILNLSGCKKIRDVNNLGDVHCLNLAECRSVRDVSELKTVYRLNLTSCNVTDVHMLGLVFELDLTDNPLITDINGLGRGNQYSVNLSFCTGIRNFCSLRKVKKINLSGCDPRAIQDSLPFLLNIETIIFSEDYYQAMNHPNGLPSAKKLIRSVSASSMKAQKEKHENVEKLLPKQLRERKVKVVIDELMGSNHSAGSNTTTRLSRQASISSAKTDMY